MFVCTFEELLLCIACSFSSKLPALQIRLWSRSVTVMAGHQKAWGNSCPSTSSIPTASRHPVFLKPSYLMRNRQQSRKSQISEITCFNIGALLSHFGVTPFYFPFSMVQILFKERDKKEAVMCLIKRGALENVTVQCIKAMAVLIF